MAPRYPGNSSFLEARNYNRTAGSNGTVTRLVVHDMEMPEKGSTAESCARYFATTDRAASAHFCIDSDSVVQCVDLDHRAYHAPPNTGSIGLEHAGYASQTMSQWLDTFGVAMLDVSARLAAWLCRTLDIPARWLTVDQLRAGARGLCTHADVTAAWGQTTHTDPGRNFPKDYYLGRVKHFYDGGNEDVALTDEDIAKLTGSAAFVNAVRTAVWKAGWGTATPGETELAEIRLYRASHPEYAAGAVAEAVQASLVPFAAELVPALADAIVDRLPAEARGLTVDDVRAAVADVLTGGTNSVPSTPA